MIKSEAAGLSRSRYVEALNLLERIHYQMILVVRDELDRRNERALNWSQAILLYKVGGRDVTASQLCQEGEYLGANVSYNLIKLTNAGYVRREPSQTDGRVIRVRLTKKGEEINNALNILFDRHLPSLEAVANIGASELATVNTILEQVEQSRAQVGFHGGYQLPNPTVGRCASIKCDHVSATF